MKKLIVQDPLVSLTRVNDDDYISLTDIARVISPMVGASLLAKMFVRFASKLAPTTSFRIDGLSGINNAAIKGVESEKITPNNPLETSPLVGASLLAKIVR